TRRKADEAHLQMAVGMALLPFGRAADDGFQRLAGQFVLRSLLAIVIGHRIAHAAAGVDQDHDRRAGIWFGARQVDGRPWFSRSEAGLVMAAPRRDDACTQQRRQSPLFAEEHPRTWPFRKMGCRILSSSQYIRSRE